MRRRSSRLDLTVIVLSAVFISAMAIVAILVFGGITQWAWNTVLPPVLGLPEISLWQAIALNVLLALVGKGVSVTKSAKT